MIDAYARAFEVMGQHLTLAFYAALVFVMGFGSAFVVVKGQLRFLMRFPLWFAAKVDELLRSQAPFVRVFLVIFLFNSAAMFLYMLSGVVDMAPGVIDFLTGMNIGIVFLGKPAPAPEETAAPDWEEWELRERDDAARPSDGLTDAATAAPGRRHLLILLGFVVVTALELPCLWMSIAMGIGLCHFAQPEGVICLFSEEIAVRAQAYMLVIVPALAISAFAETMSVKLMQEDMGPREA